MNEKTTQVPMESLSDRELEVLRLLAAGHSNQEIADALFLALSTVKWYTKQIYGKLDVHSRTQAVARAQALGLLHPPGEPPDQTPSSSCHNLPAQVTSFVGREHELIEIRELLGASRLVTLTGPPGTGKTRLAIEVGLRVVHLYGDGICFLDLAPLTDPREVPTVLAQTLGVTEAGSQPLLETLKNALSGKHILLILDNFERVIGAASLVSELLAAAPRLSVLVTSREVLRIYGEQEYPVHPLDLPDPHRAATPDAVTAVEAVQLFVERAQAVQPDFELTEENAAAVGEICARVDGLPLAIELAAARVRILSVQALASRLNERFALLSSPLRDRSPRHQTLEATIAWSHELLDEAEKALFAALSVFRGGFTAEAASAVCGEMASADVLAGLESLLTKSLLTKRTDFDGNPRFAMLETLRAYARERLEVSGRASALLRSHATYFTMLASRADPELRGGARLAYWFARLRAEQSNLRAALAWALDGADVELGLRLAAALSNFWYDEGQIGEGLRWTELALARSADAPAELRAKLLSAAGELSFAQAAYETGAGFTRRALDLYRDLGDRRNVAWAMVLLAAHNLATPDQSAEGLALCEEALTAFRELEDEPGMARALTVLGELLRLVGDEARALDAYQEARRLYHQIGDKRREGMALSNLGHVVLGQGDADQARGLFARAIELMRFDGSDYFLAFGLAGLAGPEVAQGRPEQAARLLGAAEMALANLGVDYQPADRPAIDRYRAQIEAQLGTEGFEAASAEGRSMSLAEAVAYALGPGAA